MATGWEGWVGAQREAKYPSRYSLLGDAGLLSSFPGLGGR